MGFAAVSMLAGVAWSDQRYKAVVLSKRISHVTAAAALFPLTEWLLESRSLNVLYV